MRSLQADPKGNTLPEEDARLFVEALSGLRVLLDWQPPLVEKLLSYEGAPPECTLQRLSTTRQANTCHPRHVPLHCAQQRAS